jgi:DNA-binding transcriptional ArsR family regulator
MELRYCTFKHEREGLKMNDFKNQDSPEVQLEDVVRLPRLIWDVGTAYDLFISLDVLQHPEKMGLRPSWAAGVRSRLSTGERKTLEESLDVVDIPFHWIYTLSAPKDGATALWALRQLPPAKRLPELGLSCKLPGEAQNILKEISDRRTWNQKDVDFLKEILKGNQHEKVFTGEYTQILNTWANSADFGERYLQALQSYYHAFFAEEERHIAPALAEALARAQELSERCSLEELLEELTQGLRLPGYRDFPELVLVPSYWSTPLVFLGKVNPGCSIILFGARPTNASLVPGEVVPDALLNVLKAMADPTRLRILRYLACEQLTPSEISRRLRLRAPTVTHHLSQLRLAGLVHITLEEHAERRYTARMEAMLGLNSLIREFLQYEGKE